MDPDDFLVQQARAGSRAAFDMLAIRYQRRLERLIARSIHRPADVADLVQETFLAAYRALPGFRSESAFYTWLYRIAVNLAAKHRARAAREPLQPSAGVESDESGTFGATLDQSDDETPERLLASKQLASHLNEAVDELVEEQRRALLLREVDGLSYEEIGELMQCPPGTVRSRIFRAREAIASRLRPLLNPASGGRRW